MLLYLGGILLQLIIGASSEGVSTDKTRLPAFLLVVVGQLCAGGRLAGALETNHHDHVRPAFHWQVGLDAGVDQLDQLLEDGLLDELPLVVALSHLLKVNAGANILTKGFNWEITLNSFVCSFKKSIWSYS